jgi:hypothetical protein
VEESRLHELIKLDEALQREKQLLGQQCVTVFNDQQVSARIPIPATRYAIHNLCESQLNKVYNELLVLQQKWHEYCRQNHYHKPHLFLKDSYLNVAPPSQRALKLRLVREATSTWLLRKERDTMQYEDDESFLTGLYYDALQRQRDYERYYIIANRYGPFSEEEFHMDSRPGKRYYAKITRAAIKMQLLWDRYWAVSKLRRFRACRLIQKIWRGHSTYKKLHPIIRLRLKIGKKTYYMFCFAQWREYIRFCRWIRECIRYYNSNYVERCFFGWRHWARENREIRNRRMGKVLLRARNPLLYRVFRGWKAFRTYMLALRRRLKLVFSFPHFYMWIEYTKESKLLKKLNRYAGIVQYGVRTFLLRCRYLRKKRAKVYLNVFAYAIFAKHRVHDVRQGYMQRNYDDWLPNEILRRAHRANELEKQRLQKKQLYLQEREKVYVKELVKFLSTPDGVHQLQYLAHTTLEDTLQERKRTRLVSHLFGLSTQEKHQIYDHYARLLRDECVRVTRILEAFNFDSKSPPTIKCPHPRCAATFTAEEQYHNHYFTSSLHQEEERAQFCLVAGYQPSVKVTASLGKLTNAEDFVMNFTHFHMMLRHKKGQDIYRNYFLRVYGLSGVINVLDCWLALQDWKKHPATTSVYYQKAFQIYELYLSSSGTRRLDSEEVVFPHQEAMIHVFDRLHGAVTTYAVTHDDGANNHNGGAMKRRMKQGNETETASTPSRPVHWGRSDPLTFPGFFRSIDLDFIQQLQEEHGRYNAALAAQGGVSLKASPGSPSSRAPPSSAAAVSSADGDGSSGVVAAKATPPDGAANAPPGTGGASSHLPPAVSLGGGGGGGPLSLLACFGFGAEGLRLGQVIWTPEMVLLPTIFEELEYACFKCLYLAFKRDEAAFKTSTAYREYESTLRHDQAELAKELRADYERYRWQIIRDWTRHFKAYDNVIVQRANTVVDQILDDVLEHYWQRAAKQEVHRKGSEIRLVEQAAHEEIALLRDEACAWTEENALNGLFDYYVRAFLTAMWNVPEHRKGMLQYSGLMKVTMKKRAGALGLGGGAGSGAGVKIGRSDAGLGRLIAEVNDMPTKAIPAEEYKAWFDSFFEETAKVEKAAIPMTKDAAAIRIQRRLRGLFARKLARREFAKRFKKYYDESVQAYYYHDVLTNETSWTPPRMFQRLYPHATW